MLNDLKMDTKEVTTREVLSLVFAVAIVISGKVHQDDVMSRAAFYADSFLREPK